MKSFLQEIKRLLNALAYANRASNLTTLKKSLEEEGSQATKNEKRSVDFAAIGQNKAGVAQGS